MTLEAVQALGTALLLLRTAFAQSTRPCPDIRPAGLRNGSAAAIHPPAGHTGRHLRIQPGPAVPVPVPGCGRTALTSIKNFFGA